MIGTSGKRPHRIRDVHPTRRGLVLAWFTFTLTFGILRAITWSIHAHVGGLGNVSAGSVHLHHYLWGILILMLVGVFGLIERSPTWHAWMGAAFGIGLGLIIDELALLIDLRDVYWQGAGGISIAVGLIVVGAGGGVLVMTRQPHKDDDLSGSPRQPASR
jgi:hypothetical protein